MLGLRFGLPRIGAAVASPGSDYSSWVTAINFLWTLKLECMAMGALAAYWLHGGFHRILRVLYFPLTQLAALALIFVSLWRNQIYGQFDNVVWGSAFAVLIVNLAANPRSLLKLENRPLDYLGKISFGIYVYHSFAIVGVLLFLRSWMPTQGLLFNGLLYGLAIALTLGLAALSHRYYESPFLRLKIRYMVVRSSGEAGDGGSGRGVSR
jgi:peptidoglycan/LPS O-acetylase OafA/YrhL